MVCRLVRALQQRSYIPVSRGSIFFTMSIGICHDWKCKIPDEHFSESVQRIRDADKETT